MGYPHSAVGEGGGLLMCRVQVSGGYPIQSNFLLSPLQDVSTHPHWVEVLWAFSNLCLTISSSVNYLIYMPFRKNCQKAQVICLTKIFKQNRSDSIPMFSMGSTRQLGGESPLDDRSLGRRPIRRRKSTQSLRKRCQSAQASCSTKMFQQKRSDSIPMFSKGSTSQLSGESTLGQMGQMSQLSRSQLSRSPLSRSPLSMSSLRRRKSTHSTLHTGLSQTTLLAFK